MTTGSARPLEDAYRMSQHDLVGWTGHLLGLEQLDAYQLVSQAGLAPAGNVVDTNYTMVAKLPKSLLGATHGVRRRARAAARRRRRLPDAPLRSALVQVVKTSPRRYAGIGPGTSPGAG